VKVIAAIRGAMADGYERVYTPIEEGVSGRPEPVEAVVVLRARDRAHVDKLLDAVAVVDAYLVDERAQWDRGGETVARIAFVVRAAGLTRDELATHWNDVHAPLARVHHPAVVRYTQNVVVEALTPGARKIDGIAELGFAALADVRDRMHDSPEGEAAIGADVERFLDRAAGWRMLARSEIPAR